MDFFSILLLLGGLAMFLYGMQVMGQGLERAAGGKLEKVLEKVTNNRIKGVLFGMLVTGIIQSSSATTVMVVGFVNSGIMKLSQTVGVIMGANIGTTVTAWILSLQGIESGNFVLQLFKPANFSLIFALVGVILIMFTKNEKKHVIGQILIGFTILIYGMGMMSDSVDGLKHNESFANILIMFKNPILGVILGTLVTGIIQSSSASVGILQALTLTAGNSITFSVAFPIILGQNIGTCVTALLSCIGTSRNAKRAAMVHLYFNLIGTIIFLVGTYAFKSLIPFWENTVTAANIATIHSIFNLSCTIIFLPFTKVFEKLAYLTIRGDEVSAQNDSDLTTQLLDDRFLHSPAYALECCKNVIVTMCGLAKANVYESFKLMNSYSSEAAEEILAVEKRIDTLEDRLGDYLVKLTDKDLNSTESRNVSKYLHTISDLERIGDHAENLMETAQYISKNNVKLSDNAKRELEVFTNAVSEILEMTAAVFAGDNAVDAANIEPLEEVIDLIKDTLKTRHVERLKNGQCSVESGIMFNDIISNLERVADHCSNIALYVIEYKDDKYESHEYLHRVRDGGEAWFVTKYNEYKSKYFTLIQS